MAPASQLKHRVISNTAIPYKSYTDITNNEPNFVAGQNILTTSQQLMERRPGFSDTIETNLTTFTGLVREFRWSKFDGTSFYSMVNDITAVSKVYKLKLGVDTAYSLLFTSASANPFDFAVSSDTLYYGNGTEMRRWTGTGVDTTWGIARPAAPVSVSTTGTGISSYAGGWYYRSTYWDSAAAHESSSSDLSPCTGNVSNKTIQIPVVASTNSRVTGIRVYRTTDGGSTSPPSMQEITGSPFANTTTTLTDTTADASLSTRVAPGITSNDPPTPSSKLISYGARIWTADAGTVYFSANEENSNGVNEESFPSGTSGNNYPFPRLVRSLRPMPDGVAVFMSSKIGKIEGDRRDNFRRYTLMHKRGAVSHTATCELGGSVGWLDTASQVWLDGEEIGFDIRRDLVGINHATAYMTVHIAGRFHWLLLMDGGPNAKIYPYDLDNKQWMVPWPVAGNSRCLNSEETADGVVTLSIALSGTKVYKQNNAKYNDAGTAYAASGTLNLLTVNAEGNSEWNGSTDYVAVETDSHTNSDVSVLMDDDPATGTYISLVNATTSNPNPSVTDPPKRPQGVNLVKRLYMASPTINQGERASFKLDWAQIDNNFNCYTIDIGHHPTGV